MLLIIVAALELLPPKIIGLTVDSIKEGTLNGKRLMQMVGILLGAAVVAYFTRYIWRIMIFGSSVKLAKQLRNTSTLIFTKMNQAFYQRRRIGHLMAHATNDISSYSTNCRFERFDARRFDCHRGLVLCTMALTISWNLTLICLIPMPLMAVLTSYYGKLLHARFHHAQTAFSTLNDKVQGQH